VSMDGSSKRDVIKVVKDDSIMEGVNDDGSIEDNDELEGREGSDDTMDDIDGRDDIDGMDNIDGIDNDDNDDNNDNEETKETNSFDRNTLTNSITKINIIPPPKISKIDINPAIRIQY